MTSSGRRSPGGSSPKRKPKCARQCVSLNLFENVKKRKSGTRKGGSVGGEGLEWNRVQKKKGSKGGRVDIPVRIMPWNGAFVGGHLWTFWKLAKGAEKSFYLR